MPVPTSLATLSQTPGSNSPAGSDAVFPSLDDYLRETFADLARLRDGANSWLTSVSGTNTITATCSSINALVAGQVFRFVASANTGAVTLNINGLGAKAVTRPGSVALVAGDMPTFAEVGYNGTTFEILNSRRVASADSATTATTTTSPKYQTGAIIPSISTEVPAGTVAMDGGTIGDASSGGTSRANADAADLFAVLWNGSTNAVLPIQNSSGAATTRGASAAADFAAHKRLPVPTLVDGQALLAAVSSTVMTATVGTVLNHTHGVTDPGHTHDQVVYSDTWAGTAGSYKTQAWNGFSTAATASATAGITVNTNTSGTAMNQAAGMYVMFYLAL